MNSGAPEGEVVPASNYTTSQIISIEFEDTKGVIRIRISKMNRQHNDQKKKYKRTNSELQKIHIRLTNKQFTDTGNIWHTRHIAKTNKTQNNTETQKDEQHGSHKKPRVNSGAREE
jgi:hypothetical protein